MKSPTDVGTGRGSRPTFTEEDRLFFFEQIKERASRNPHVIQTALANPLDKFQLGIRKFKEGFMVQRMGENDKIVLVTWTTRISERGISDPGERNLRGGARGEH